MKIYEIVNLVQTYWTNLNEQDEIWVKFSTLNVGMLIYAMQFTLITKTA